MRVRGRSGGREERRVPSAGSCPPRGAGPRVSRACSPSRVLAGFQRPEEEEEEVWLPGRVGLPDTAEPHCDPAVPETLPTSVLCAHIRPGGVSARLSGGPRMRVGCFRGLAANDHPNKKERALFFFFLSFSLLKILSARKKKILFWSERLCDRLGVIEASP